jgi:hypothetical protein
LSFEKLIEKDAYEKNGFQSLLFIVCIGDVCANHVGGMSTKDAGKLSVGTSIWIGGEDKGI